MLKDFIRFSTNANFYVSNFKTHMSHHSEEGKDGEEKCKYCDYYASSRALIRKHENTHVKLEDTFEKICGAKKFACKLCPYKAVSFNKFLFLSLNDVVSFFN